MQGDAALTALYDRLTSCIEELMDISKEVSNSTDGVEYDPELIAELNDRLSTLYRLQKKHGAPDINQLIDLQQQLEGQLSGYSDLSASIASLESELEVREKQLIKMAQALSKKRKICTSAFEKKIDQLLETLAMENANLRIDIEQRAELGPSGLDDITFLFSPNKGSDFKPLKDIASGGEISRLTLCIKSVVANALTLPTLIFDEIDTGVSGEVAGKMGDIIRTIASNHQVISITHSPQIAAKGERHFFVHKDHTDTRTLTAMKTLDGPERVEEIAKMLSGDPPSASAVQTATELLTT